MYQVADPKVIFGTLSDAEWSTKIAEIWNEQKQINPESQYLYTASSGYTNIGPTYSDSSWRYPWYYTPSTSIQEYAKSTFNYASDWLVEKAEKPLDIIGSYHDAIKDIGYSLNRELGSAAQIFKTTNHILAGGFFVAQRAVNISQATTERQRYVEAFGLAGDIAGTFVKVGSLSTVVGIGFGVAAGFILSEGGEWLGGQYYDNFVANRPSTSVPELWTLGPPIILDLDGDGIELSAPSTSNVLFDMDGDGVLERTGWAGANDGMLVIDLNGDGQITSTDELVLTTHAPGSTSDLEALKLAFDSNQDLVFDSADSSWSSFRVWQDANQNGISDSGELHTLAQLGITSFDLDVVTSVTPTDVSGNHIGAQTLFHRADGTTGAAADVGFAYDPNGYTLLVNEIGQARYQRQDGSTVLMVDSGFDVTVDMQAQGLDGVFGADGNDIISNHGASDGFASGMAGDDLMFGGIGKDDLFGGVGNDQLWGDVLESDSRTGVDFLDGEDGDDKLIGDSLEVTASGSDDLLVGGAGNDLILGDAESLSGEGGDDALFGDEGDDILIGDANEVTKLAGDDLISGGVGNDVVYGDGLVVAGVSGNDLIAGEDGNDILYGDAFDLTGVAGDDIVDGGAGDDLLVGDAWTYNAASPPAGIVTNATGADTLIGGAGNDSLFGGVGSDVAVYRGNQADYEIINRGAFVTVRDLRDEATMVDFDGTDTLTGVETLRFADGDVAIDANAAPVAVVDDLAGTVRGTMVITSGELLANDFDLEGDALSIIGVGKALHGSVSIDEQGQILFTPEAGYTGKGGFTYTVSDGKGGIATARASLTIQQALPDDPLYAKQWHLQAINAPAAWEDYTGAGVLVGNLDGPVEYTHPDLVANYDTARDYDFTTGDNDPIATAIDDQKHATSVLGIIAASRNNIGSVGVALMLLVMVLITGCAPIAFMKERPTYKGLEIDFVNAELMLPEFSKLYPGIKRVSDLSFLDVKRTLEKKKCSIYSLHIETGAGCYVIEGGRKMCDSAIKATKLPPWDCLAIQIINNDINADQLRHIEEILLNICVYFPQEESRQGQKEYTDWFGCSPDTKRVRWYSYLLHDPDGNLLMMIDPKTQTVKRF